VATVPPRSTVDWTLTVVVKASDPSGSTITQAPAGIEYAMSDIDPPWWRR
jgi:hypothetical protein